MDNDLISRSALTEVEKIICKMYLEDLDKFHTCNEYKLLMSLIDNASTVEQRPQGEWVKVVNKISECETETHWECSECHNPDFRLGEAEFCSFCGASMKGGTEE